MTDTDTEIPQVDTGGVDTTPKLPHQDQLAYMIVAAGLADYAHTHNPIGLLVAVLVYAVGYFALRINNQNKKGKA